MTGSYIENCFIKPIESDHDIVSGTIKSDKGLHDVTVRLNGYAIVPLVHYRKLEAISEKVEAMI